jgi:hypothetical protein
MKKTELNRIPQPSKETFSKDSLARRMNVNSIILDKCYLQGTSVKSIQELSDRFQLLMPDVLFYEMISSDEPGRSRCFRKFPQKSNPIPIAKHVGALLKKELTTHEPAGLPSENLEALTYRFNPALSDGSYELSDADTVTMREIEAELKSDISRLIEKSHLIPTIFPNIGKGSSEERKKCKAEIEKFIANDVTKLRKFLSSFKLPGDATMPAEEHLNTSWALFRWLQVQLLFSLDIRDRHGDIDSYALTPNHATDLEHDVLDAHYLILGVLQYAFATREKKLMRFFNLLCPEGILVT